MSSDRKEARVDKPDNTLPRARYDNWNLSEGARQKENNVETHVFRESTRGSQ